MKGLNKYGNISTCVEGHLFASRREARRYQELKFLELAKEISELELQPKFDLVVEGMKVCSYIADFRYKLKKNDLGFKKNHYRRCERRSYFSIPFKEKTYAGLSRNRGFRNMIERRKFIKRLAAIIVAPAFIPANVLDMLPERLPKKKQIELSPLFTVGDWVQIDMGCPGGGKAVFRVMNVCKEDEFMTVSAESSYVQFPTQVNFTMPS